MNKTVLLFFLWINLCLPDCILWTGEVGIKDTPSFEDDFDYPNTPGGYNWRDDWIRVTWTMNSTQMAPERAVPENGMMKITINGGSPYQGGCIQTRKKDFSYGRWEARMKLPSEPGSVTSIFLIDWDDESTSSSDSDGTRQEVDIEFLPYTFGGGRGEAHFAIHARGHKNHMVKEKKLDFDPSADFHVWGFEVLPDRINWFVDNKYLHTYMFDNQVRIDAPYQFYIVGWTDNSAWVKGPPARTDYFLIDWVRFYPEK